MSLFLLVVAPARKKRPATQSNVSAALPPKKKASEKKQTIIPKKLSYEKTDAELDASVKSDVDSFFKNIKLKVPSLPPSLSLACLLD